MVSLPSLAGMTWGLPVLFMRVRLWTPSMESIAARPASRSAVLGPRRPRDPRLVALERQ